MNTAPKLAAKSKPAPTSRPVAPALYRRNDLPGLLNCSIETVDRMRSTGKFPRPDVMLGTRSPAWRPETVERWIQNGGGR